jgi:hypothetical protein
MSGARLLSPFRTSPASSPDTHRPAPARTPGREAPPTPKSGKAGIFQNLSKFVRQTMGASSSSSPAPSQSPPRSAAPRANLTRQNALSPEKRKEYEANYPQRGSLGGRAAPSSPEEPVKVVSKAEAQRRAQLLAARLGGGLPSSSGGAVGASTSKPATSRLGLAKKTGATASSSTANVAQGAAPQPSARRGRIPFESLEPDVQKALLDRLDPVRRLGLTDDTVFYRTLDKSWLKNGPKRGTFVIEGNPNSIASVNNYLQLQRNRFLESKEHMAMLPPEVRQSYQNDPSMRYMPARTPATELPHPTLNVMYGARATEGTEGYTNKNHVLVKMTLGDLRKAGGGQVFNDDSAAARADDCHPFIVTLPAGKSVPVQIVR